jgi:phosphoglycolate phosphatase
VTLRLDGIDLVIFDKDGTIIQFGPMWSDWAVALGEALDAATRRPVAGAVYAMLGVDPANGAVLPGGALAATPMARLRDETLEVLLAAGVGAGEAERALQATWRAPDPVATAQAMTDLPALFDALRAEGRRVAVATSDDRDPTERTMAALGLTDRIDAFACADDGIAGKPAPDMVLHLCATLGVAPAQTAVVGDTGADLLMGRAAGAGLVVGVLTGVGGRDDLAPIADAVIASVEELRPV